MKIAVIPGGPLWAFGNRAKDLKNLSFDHIQIDVIYLQDVTYENTKEYDLLYPMSLTIVNKLNKSGIPLNRMATGITSERVFTSKMVDGKIKQGFINKLHSLRGVNAWSDKIIKNFKPQYEISKTRIGIDEKKFKPATKPRKRDKFTVGWVGRIDKGNYRKLKGYDLVLKAIKGLDVTLEIRTYKENFVPRDQMVEFYQGLDCFICSSQSEGLPNPVLEAASCGVPIISTNVGFVPEIIQHKNNGLIIDRNVKSIRKAINYLMKNENHRRRMGRNIRKTVVKNWTWEDCKKDWENFFLSLKE
ncbi:glycosyltransferase family 4 protein [Evansella tamaricis]|uniref:Glycosyltransferase family 4 protein n=1 Tax=Evansella tamaricis TaxID=2069301 RepID=A0ABS6JLY2_9BACI|nr:glycosyltransferase family 4 protein [Evansella tamaricis]MBU9713318.1 glycosyltransferase family 4 protein [Evansella tamaricis]